MSKPYSVYLIKQTDNPTLLKKDVGDLEASTAWTIDYVIAVHGSVKIEKHDSPRGLLLKSAKFSETYLVTNQKLERR